MEALKIQNRTLNDNFFKILMREVKCDTGDDKNDIGFSSKWMHCIIDFYINDGDESDILIDDFGFMEAGEWIQCEPTKKQMEKMKKVISNKLDELFEAESESEVDEDFNGDYYDYYGVNRAMFI